MRRERKVRRKGKEMMRVRGVCENILFSFLIQQKFSPFQNLSKSTIFKTSQDLSTPTFLSKTTPKIEEKTSLQPTEKTSTQQPILQPNFTKESLQPILINNTNQSLQLLLNNFTKQSKVNNGLTDQNKLNETEKEKNKIKRTKQGERKYRGKNKGKVRTQPHVYLVGGRCRYNPPHTPTHFPQKPFIPVYSSLLKPHIPIYSLKYLKLTTLTTTLTKTLSTNLVSSTTTFLTKQPLIYSLVNSQSKSHYSYRFKPFYPFIGRLFLSGVYLSLSFGFGCLNSLIRRFRGWIQNCKMALGKNLEIGSWTKIHNFSLLV